MIESLLPISCSSYIRSSISHLAAVPCRGSTTAPTLHASNDLFHSPSDFGPSSDNISMPARNGASVTFHCNCFTCLEEGPRNSAGVALGRDLPVSARLSHQIRIQAEIALKAKNAELLEDISSSIFTATLSGQSSASDSQPSRLWASREECQSLVQPLPCNLTAEPPLDSIIHGIQQLSLQASEPNNTADTPLDSVIDGIQQLNLQASNPNDNPLPFSTVNDSSLSANLVHEVNISPSTPSVDRASKNERSHLTAKAHMALDKIDDCIKSCSIRLDNPTLSTDTILQLQDEVGSLKQALDNVRRNVHSVNVRRIATTASLNGLFAHLEGLQKQHPMQKNTVLKYNSGTSEYFHDTYKLRTY
jgi:hypothetical protein